MSGRVLILQNLTHDGPGYLATWLVAQGIGFDVFNTEAGAVYPASVTGYRGLALMGGEMSANDDLPSLRQAERLIIEAMDQDIPVLGHCLGGQLMAKALGAAVVASPAPEIGWQTMQVADNPEAADWLGAAGPRTVYHWHAETFGLPSGAHLLASSPACPNQAYAWGRHIGMQFHVELDAAKLAAWSASTDPGYLAAQQAHPATVQNGAAMRAQAVNALRDQQALAARIYGRWLG